MSDRFLFVTWCGNIDGLAGFGADGALGEQALEMEGLRCLGTVEFGGPKLVRQCHSLLT